MILLVLTLMLAFTLSLYGVPMARRAALKFGIVDSPDGRLKHQREPVPYLGGLAIYLAFLISLAFTFEFRHDVLGIVLAGTLVMMLGLIDDFGVLTPGIKLLGQLLAVFILIKSGIRIEIASLPAWIDIGLTILWMVGMINALNLLDIMDGLSAGVGVISAIFLCIVAILNGDQTITFMLVALIGSLLGFLRYNWSPASIYMGDAGAMFIGLMLGSLSMIGKYTEGHDLSPDARLDSGHADFRHTLRHVHSLSPRTPDFSGKPRSHGDSAAPLGIVGSSSRFHQLCRFAGWRWDCWSCRFLRTWLRSSGMTVAVLGIVAVGLARVKVIHGSPPLSHETLHG